MKYFINLARREYDAEANLKVKEELEAAGIPVISLRNRLNGEVQTNYMGVLNGFVFERAWKYWIVTGNMPLDKAITLYNKHKELEIRVEGHAANPHPKDWARDPIYDKDLAEIIEKVGYTEYLKNKKKLIPDQNSEKYRNNPKYIQMYHIDTEEGLAAFVKYIKENNIQTGFID